MSGRVVSRTGTASAAPSGRVTSGHPEAAAGRAAILMPIARSPRRQGPAGPEPGRDNASFRDSAGALAGRGLRHGHRVGQQQLPDVAAEYRADDVQLIQYFCNMIQFAWLTERRSLVDYERRPAVPGLVVSREECLDSQLLRGDIDRRADRRNHREEPKVGAGHVKVQVDDRRGAEGQVGLGQAQRAAAPSP
jgi:hypothetical protein